MKKKRFTEQQIVKILKEYESGVSAADLCRQHQISKPTFYNWKQKYSGMSSSDLKKLKDLEQENKRLKKMFAELSLDHELLKEIIEKKL